MSNPVYKSGYLGTISLGTNELSVRQSSVTGRGTVVEFENSRTGPTPAPAVTWVRYPITMLLDCDFANGLFSSPYNVAVGAQLTNLNVYQQQASKSALGTITTALWPTLPVGWSFSNFCVTDLVNTIVVEGAGKVTYNVNGLGYGTIVTPG